MHSWPLPPLPPRIAASTQLPFVGRRVELETMERVWAEVDQGRRQVLFVGGEPGAGKTRLLAEIAGALHANEVPVLVGTSSLDAVIPYEPFRELLDHLFATAPEGALAELVDAGGAELLRLSSHVTRHQAGLASHEPLGGEVRRDLFDAVARVLRLLTRDRPAAVMLDDLHWAEPPTLALLEHLVQTCPQAKLLVLATFRNTAPDRSPELAARLAGLHRLDGVRRIDLGALDTDAIADYVCLRSSLPRRAVRAPAAILRDRTGGNPFFLRELWADLEQRGGVSALRASSAVPASIGDTLAARVAGLTVDAQRVLEVAAVLGDSFDLATLVAASEANRDQTMISLDAAVALGLVEAHGHELDRYAFVHALTRQAVVDRMAPSRRAALHARAAEALQRQPGRPTLVPRLASHYLAAQILGYQEQAITYSTEAGRLAARSLAFEDAAGWFERAASLPECPPDRRADLLLAAAENEVRACQFEAARARYEELAGETDPTRRLVAAMGFEDATWRPGVAEARAADLLSTALDECGLGLDDERYVRGLASLGRALVLAGEAGAARQVGGRAIDLARGLGKDDALLHALTASLWHGTTPEMVSVQQARCSEALVLAEHQRDFEALGAVANFRATVGYVAGEPAELEAAIVDAGRAVRATGQPYYRGVLCSLSYARAFLRGDFAAAERWAEEMLEEVSSFDGQVADGPYGVQLYMLRRETGGLDRFGAFLDGSEALAGRWVPGLLALYTELGITTGVQRTLRHLMSGDLASRADEAPWPMELAFLVDGALAVGDREGLARLRPFLEAYRGRNLACGTLIATLGSADGHLARLVAALGDADAAERHFAAALALDERTGSVVHLAETLAHHSRFAAAHGNSDRAAKSARRARQLAEPIGQRRVLALLQGVSGDVFPDGLTHREVEVLRLVTGGLSNHEIGERLHISGNTAANHVRRILLKTGAANRTQAAVYAAQHQLV